MKKIFFFLIILLTGAATAVAQQPEKIYGKNRVLKTNDYFLLQMSLWKKEVEKDPKNADAWFNYYRADRNAYIVGEEKDSLNAKGIDRFQRLKKIVDDMEKQVPDSYEYNFVKWLNGNNDGTLFPYLERAHSLAPDKIDPIMGLMLYYEINGDDAKRNKAAVAAYNTGDYSPGLLNYSYNMLMGLEKNAIIFTEGDKDTEATFLLQQAKGIRTDVRLVNMNLLLMKPYRERIFKELEIPPISIDPLESTENYDAYRKLIVEQFTKNVNKRPVYVGVTVRYPYTEPIKEKLYLTGLAYQYSNSKMDNIAVLEKNYEEKYALDYLNIYLPYDLSQGNVHQFNENYIQSLAMLNDDYLKSGNRAKADYYKTLAEKIRDDAGEREIFDAFFKK